MKKIIILITLLTLVVSCGTDYKKMSSEELDKLAEEKQSEFIDKVSANMGIVTEKDKKEIMKIGSLQHLVILKRSIEAGEREVPKRLKVIYKTPKEIEEIKTQEEITDLYERLYSKLWYTGEWTEKDFIMADKLTSQSAIVLGNKRWEEYKKLLKDKQK